MTYIVMVACRMCQLSKVSCDYVPSARFARDRLLRWPGSLRSLQRQSVYVFQTHQVACMPLTPLPLPWDPGVAQYGSHGYRALQEAHSGPYRRRL